MSYTTNWSGQLARALSIVYPQAPKYKMICVEIGAYEGRGSKIIYDKLCGHPESQLYCLDPWDDVYVTSGEGSKYQMIDHLFKGQYERFVKNTEELSKLVILRGYSTTEIPKLPKEVDFAFVDGDHSPDQVYLDGCLLMEHMSLGGVIVFDDYKWCRNGQYCQIGIDRFLEEYKDKLEVIHKEHAVIVRVIE